MERTVTPHYTILDGLRGVAAVAVLCFHLFEAVAFAAGEPEQKMFNGFMAVDFFFILSGFVMGYAYDERWNRMSVGNFIKRRLIRLHPMVVMGVVLGVIAFCIQGCTRWDGSAVSPLLLLLGTVLALFLLPAPTSMEVRGNTEAFPLNGPHWSLFFEYIGSLLYALMLRKLPTRILKVWVPCTLLALIVYACWMSEATIGYGWSSLPGNLLGGLLRLTFGYPAGLLLARLFREKKPKHVKGPVFLIAGVVLILLLCVPNLGTACRLWYQILCIAVAFPVIVWMGACGTTEGNMDKAARLLGRISYPLYAIHYPLIYLYIHWINTKTYPFGPYEWCTPVAVFCIALVMAYIIMRWYDEPVRRKLQEKFL